MDRRDFLKRTGLGSLGLAALPALQHLAATPAAAAAGQSGFIFVAHSVAGTIDGVKHRVVAFGSGSFVGSQVWGDGGFAHFDDAPAAPPKPVLAAGTWTAQRVVNYAPYGIAGPAAAGFLDMEVELNRQIPSPAVFPGKLRLVCNIGFRGIQTGQHEGFVLALPGSPFVSGGAGGAFKPLDPNVGLTVFTPGSEGAAFDPVWEQEFQRVHGAKPTPQDRAGRLWSLDFAAQNGRPPNDAEWIAYWRSLQGWI